MTETLFTNISPNATINITNDTIVIKTDGNGDYNFTGNGRFKINDDFIAMNGGERELKVQVKNGKIKSIDGFTDEDVVKVSKSGNIRINGQKIMLKANTDMDMYGKPARAGGGESSDLAESADTADNSEKLTENQNDVESKSKNFDYKSSDEDTETADFTITAKNLDAAAVTAELVQKVLGTDKQEVDSLNGENLSDNRAPKFGDCKPAVNETTSADMQTIVIPADEFFDVNKLFDVSDKIITPQEKNFFNTTDASDFGFKELIGLQFEEILPEKNISADFVLNR